MATDPAVLAAEMTRDLRAALRPAMEALGRDMQSEMRDLISVPVQYVSAGGNHKPNRVAAGAGHRVIRSKRGEPPRKEFGFLKKSMTTDTADEANGITVRMGSDEAIADYSKWLEGRLDRPHFVTIFSRVQQYAVDRILSRLPQTI